MGTHNGKKKIENKFFLYIACIFCRIYVYEDRVNLRIFCKNQWVKIWKFNWRYKINDIFSVNMQTIIKKADLKL